MFEFQQGETGLHKIENPSQVFFIAVVVILILVGVSLGIGYFASKA